MSEHKAPRAPSSLGKRGRHLWRQVLVVEEYELAASELALLEAAALAFDRLTEAQGQLDRDGLTVPGRYGPRAHPMAAVVRDSTTLLARCLRQLDIALEEPPLPVTPFRAKPGPRPKPHRRPA